MIKKFLDLFGSPKAPEVKEVLPTLTVDKAGLPVSEGVVIAISVILVHIASSDDQVAQEEAEAICSLLDFNLGLPESEIPVVVEKAIMARREASRMDDHTFIINNTYSVPQRLRVLAMAWKLVLSDNKVEKPEERLLVKLATLLSLSLQDQDKAKLLAEEGAV